MVASSAGAVRAQIIWTDTAGDSSWSDTANWNPSTLPGSSTAVQIGSMLGTDNIVGIDTGTNVTVASFTFNSTLNTMSNPPVQVRSNTEQLTVNGAITNNSSVQAQLLLTVNAGVSATYAGGAGGLTFDFLNVNTETISTSGTVKIGSGGTLVFDIDSVSSYGSIGSIDVSGANIDITGTYAGHAGDSFDLTSGNFSGATLEGLPTLSAGLTWNTSNFASIGLLSVNTVPEPPMEALVSSIVGFLLLLRCQRFARKSD